MVRPRLKVFWFNKDNLTGHSEKTDRKGGKTISKCGQEWTLPAQLGQLKTGQGGYSPGAYVVPVNMNVNFWQHA